MSSRLARFGCTPVPASFRRRLLLRLSDCSTSRLVRATASTAGLRVVCRALGERGPALIALDSAHDAELPAWLAQRLLPPGGTLLLLTSDPALAAAVGASSVALDDQNGSRATRLAALCAAYDALMPDIQWRFRSLGAFAPGLVDPRLAAEVWGDSPEDAGRCSRMAGRCPVWWRAKPAGDWLTHRLDVRTCAIAAAALPQAERAGAQQRHAAAVLARAVESESAYRVGRPDGFAENWPQVAVAFERASARNDECARAWIDALLGSAPSVIASIAPPELRAQWLTQALRPANTPGRRRWEARHLISLAAAQREFGEARIAAANAREAIALSLEAGDPAAEASAHAQLGMALLAAGQSAGAIGPLTTAIAAPSVRDDPRLLRAAAQALALAESAVDRHAQAADALALAVAADRQIGDARGELEDREHLAELLSVRPATRSGAGSPAAEAYRQALLFANRLGDDEAEQRLSRGLGDLCAAERPEEALTYYLRGLALSRKAADELATSGLLCRAGAVYNDLGQPDAGLEAFEQALMLANSAPSTVPGDTLAARLTATMGLSESLARLGQRPAAAVSALAALPLARELGDEESEMALLTRLGEAHLVAGEYEPAADCFVPALALSQRLDRRQEQLALLMGLAEARFALGLSGVGVECLVDAVPLARELGRPTIELAALRRLGQAHSETERAAEAAACYEPALKLSQWLGAEDAEADILACLAACQMALGRPQVAAYDLRTALLLRNGSAPRDQRLLMTLRLAEAERLSGRPADAVRTADAALAAQS